MVDTNLPASPDAVPATPPVPASTDEVNVDGLPTEPNDITATAPADPAAPADTVAEPPTAPKVGEPEAPADPKSVPNQIFKRMKTAEESVKAYKEKFGDLPVDDGRVSNPSAPSAPVNTSDPIAIARAAKVLGEYDEVELDQLAIVATGLGVSPVEAAQSDGFKTFVSGHRTRIKKDNAVPAPSGNAPTHLDKTEKEIGEMSEEDFKKLESETNQNQNTKGI